MSTYDRNRPCPCGSGKRYKHCHGRVFSPDTARLAEASEAHSRGALRRAEALYRKALVAQPDDVTAQQGLAAVLFDRMHYAEALGLFRDAAERTEWADATCRRNLGLTLAKLLSADANARQDALLARYLDRERARLNEPARVAAVAVLVVANRERSAVDRSIESITAQTLQASELIVVDNVRGLVGAINLAAERSPAEYLAILEAGDEFAPTRIAEMASEIVHARPSWGFSRVEFRTDHRNPRDDLSAAAGQLPSFALTHRDIAVANGNLFVARGLFLDAGGYREVKHRGWDLGWRLSRVVEPVFVDRALYRVGGHDRPRSSADPDSEAQEAIERQHQQHVVDALMSDAPAANEFSPQFPDNHVLLLRSELRAGRGDLIPPQVLRALADEWRARIEASPCAAPAAVSPESTPGRPGSRDLNLVAAANAAGIQAATRVAIVILGTYRSGTSALARVLNLCGATLPMNLMPARLDLNRKGFWESEAIVELDSKLLQRLGAEWHSSDVTLPTDGPVIEEFLAMAGELLEREFGSAGMILLKDPRMCVLAPIWHRALVESGYCPRYVVSVRHPLEVAGSLARSLRSDGGLELRDGLALWQGYMSRADTFCKQIDAEVAYVRYDELLGDWRGVLARIARRIGVPLDAESRSDEIARFLEPSMRSQHAGRGDLDVRLTGVEGDATRSLYARLLSRCEQDLQ